MMRRALCLIPLCLVLFPFAASAAGIPAPPGLVAMWNGRDGAAVRAELRRYSADGERAGASASQRLEAGEAAYWLGVQDARAGRPDSALAQWRRALVLRGDFDEGFALIDALLRRGQPADVAEARAHAGEFSQQSNLSMPRRAPEAHARLAWAMFLQGHPDSALAEVHDHCEGLYRRPAWTRRFAQLQLAAGDAAGAWRAAVLLSARTRRRDAEAETLLVRTQRALRYIDERRQLSVGVILDRITSEEESFAQSLGGRIETLHAKDGFGLQIFTFPAARAGARRAPLLYVLSPSDTVTAVDSLVAAFTRAGHPVALLAPRGSFGSLGPGATSLEAGPGRESTLEPLVAADAGAVMDALARRADFGGAAWIVGAGGERAPCALAAARARRTTPALLLVAPRLPVVEVAEFRARLRLTRMRTFVQVSPEEPDALELGDLLARATAQGQVRIADSGLAGRGGAIFRGDAKVAQRLLAWLEERPAAK